MSLSLEKYPEPVVLSGNPVEVIISTTTADVKFHRLHIRVYDENDNFIGEDSLPPVNGKAVFDISDYLNKEKRSKYELADFFYKGIKETDFSDKYYFKYFERHENSNLGLSPRPVRTPRSADFTVLQGGLSRAFSEYYTQNNYTFYSKFINEDKFFLSWDRDKYIARTQVQIVYFLLTQNQNIESLFVLYFDDGTTEVSESTEISGTAYNVYALNVSVFANGFASFEEGRKLIKFDVRILGDTGGTFDSVSVTKTFFIYERHERFARQFLFKNSLGVYDFIALSGITEAENKFTRTISASEEGRNKIVFSAFESEKKTNSAWINEKYLNIPKAMNYMTELLNSAEVYEIYKNHIVEIIPLSKKLEIFSDEKFLYAFDFKYKTAYEELFFSDFLEAPFQGIPGAAFRCSNPDYDSIENLFKLTILRIDNFDTASGHGSLTFKIFSDNIYSRIFNFSLAGEESKVLDLDLAQYPDIKKIEWAGSCEGFVLFAGFMQSNCINCNADFEMKFYDENISIASITSHSGTAQLEISDNKIKTISSGTLYNLKLKDSAGTDYLFPASEGGYTLHCVLTKQKALLSNFSQNKQDNFHYNLKHGLTKLNDDNTAREINVPYTENKEKIYTS